MGYCNLHRIPIKIFGGRPFLHRKGVCNVFFPAVIILLFEVNHFFLKYELWVPPTNPLNTIRLSFLFLLALPGIKVRNLKNRLLLLHFPYTMHIFFHPAWKAPRLIHRSSSYRFIVFIQEYYEFIDSGDTDLFRKVGTFAWLGMAVAFIETLATIKFGHGLFPQPWPKHVLVAWGTVSIVFLIVFSTWTVRFYRKEGGGGMGGGGQRRQTRAKTRRS